MKAIIVIPARYASTRFPGKPLALISGQSLIRRVHDRAVRCGGADGVWIATDDQRIADHVRDFGGEVIMTGEAESGTDRVAQALAAIESSRGDRYDQVINLQGDEPLIDIEGVERMIVTLQKSDVDIVTLAAPLDSEEEYRAPDVVKVVADLDGNALYFSRAAIPHGNPSLARRHVGIYGYQAAVLRRLAVLEQSPLERAEKLEQLRALQNGFKIRLLDTSAAHLGVDRPEDVARVESELARLHLR